MIKTVNRKTTETALDAVNFVAGICLMLAPWVLGFAGETKAAWDAWLTGAAIALVAIGALVAFAPWEEWLNLLLGIWAIIAPWALGFSALTYAVAAHVVVGVVVALAAAIELWFTKKRPVSMA